jgi:hypothetical protein
MPIHKSTKGVVLVFKTTRNNPMRASFDIREPGLGEADGGTRTGNGGGKTKEQGGQE